MSRIARLAVEGVPHHVTQRGNGKQQVFGADPDYRLYLSLLRRYSTAYELDIWAYCLMPNHIHLVAVPARETSMAKALGRVHAEYAKYFNLVRQSCGHVWQARYFSCPLDGAHLWRAMAYVERNPVRAGIVEEASAYRWSSAAIHLGKPAPTTMLNLTAWRKEYTPERWASALRTNIADEELSQRLREATLCGRPLGGADFIEQLEMRTGRRLRKRNRNRDSTLCHQSEQALLSFGPENGD